MKTQDGCDWFCSTAVTRGCESDLSASSRGLKRSVSIQASMQARTTANLASSSRSPSSDSVAVAVVRGRHAPSHRGPNLQMVTYLRLKRLNCVMLGQTQIIFGSIGQFDWGRSAVDSASDFGSEGQGFDPLRPRLFLDVDPDSMHSRQMVRRRTCSGGGEPT